MLHKPEIVYTRDNPVAIIVRDAVAKPTSWNASERTIEAVIASATPVPRVDEQGPYLEILDARGADLSTLIGAQVLDGHRAGGTTDILGVVIDARIEGSEIIATLALSARSELAPIVRDIGAGIIRNVSVGYVVQTWAEGTLDGKRSKTASVWSPREVSFVAIGADPTARTRNHPMNDRTALNREIRTLAQRAGVAQAAIDEMIDRQVTLDEARGLVLDDVIRRGVSIQPSRHNDQTMDNPQAFQRAMSDALFTRVSPSFKPEGAALQYVGLSLVEIGRTCLHRAGIATNGLNGSSIITRALAPMSTSDFPSIMASVFDKTLQESYRLAPSGLRPLARQTTAADFRTKYKVKLDATSASLQPLGEGGEYRHGSFSDAKESYKLSTFGVIVGVSRQLLVNDDVGAFSDIPRRLGMNASAFEASFLADLVIDNPTMDDTYAVFSSQHGNLAGSGAAPDETTLSAGRLAMRLQTTPGGELVNAAPRYLVVGADLETAAQKLIADITPTTIDDVNAFAKLALVVEPRLPEKAWYLWADPATADALEFAYLAGQPGVYSESRSGWEVDGMEHKVRLDLGGGWTDYRGAYRNPGQ